MTAGRPPVASLVVIVTALVASAHARADDYVVDGEASLVVLGDGALEHSWSASCEGSVAAPPAALAVAARELRFAGASEQIVAVDAHTVEVAVDGTAAGTTRFSTAEGVSVFARFVARCGDDVVFDEIVVDTAAVTTPPGLSAPASLLRTDTLENVVAVALPADVEIELTGLQVRARPRGDDVVELRLSGAGVDDVLVFDESDFPADGVLLVSPRVTPPVAGTLVVTVALRGVVGDVFTLEVVDTDDSLFTRAGGALSAGCAIATGTSAPPAAFALLLLAASRLRRRRR
jgi:MYXO-CTERM domain-containing protein